MSEELLRLELEQPLVLFFLMIFASIGNGAKQIVVIRQTAKEVMTCGQYWSYLPETVATLVTNVLAFALLLLTKQLNFASAIAVGYGANSLSDLIPRGRRSYDLKSTPDDPAKLKQ